LAGEKPEEPEKVEAKPEPEAGKSKEPEKKEPEREHGPGWYRRKIKQDLVPLKAEIAELREQLAARNKPEPDAETPAATTAIEPTYPVEEEFRTVEEYDKAVKEYPRALAIFHGEQSADRKVAAFRKEVATTMEEEAQEAQRRQEEEVKTKQKEKFDRDTDDGRARYPNFQELVLENPNINVPRPINDYIFTRLDHPADSAYFLASNPAEIARIAKLPKDHQIYELRKIDAQFSVEEKLAPEKSTQVTAPQKPKPLTPTRGGNSAAVIPKIDDPEVTSDFQRWERMEMEQRNRR